MRSAAVMLLIALAWNADVEALPIHQDTGGADLGAPGDPVVKVDTSMARSEVVPKAEIKDAPKTAATAGAAAAASASMAKVKEALAQVHGVDPSRAPSSTRSSSLSSASSYTPPPSTDFPSADGAPGTRQSTEPMTLSTPSMSVERHLFPEKTFVKPPPEEFINRDKKPGDAGYIKQNAERAIYTAEHELHHIDVRLQRDRDAAYDHARGSHNVLVAAQAGSVATAEMANAVREEQENGLATLEQKIQNVKVSMIDHAGVNNKQHAKLQLELERLKRKHAELLATTETMGAAVDSAITKAGEIEGRARAAYNSNMDPNMELEHAVVAAARAKMALEEHDKTVALENGIAREDEKKKVFFNKVEEKGLQAVKNIEENYQGQQAQMEEEDYKKNMEAAKRVEEQAKTSGTVPAPKQMPETLPGAPTVSQPITTAADTVPMPAQPTDRKPAEAGTQAAIQNVNPTPEAANQAPSTNSNLQTIQNQQKAVDATVQESRKLAEQAVATENAMPAAKAPAPAPAAAPEAEPAAASEEASSDDSPADADEAPAQAK